MTSSEIFDKFLITSNLEDTFDPPTIESIGKFFELIACCSASVSFSKSSPAHDTSEALIAP